MRLVFDVKSPAASPVPDWSVIPGIPAAGLRLFEPEISRPGAAAQIPVMNLIRKTPVCRLVNRTYRTLKILMQDFVAGHC